MPRPGLVIFDCDGVLIDSELIAARIFARCLDEAGFAATPDEALELGWGKNAATLLVAVEERYKKQFGALDLLLTQMQQTSSSLAQQLASLPGLNSR